MGRELKGKVLGVCPSKSNSYKIVKVGDYSKLSKTTAMEKYEESFLWQVGSIRDANVQGVFEFYIDVFFPSKRSDLDGCLKGVLDCLQRAKVIKNDNNCCKIIARKFIDKENPRVEFTIKEI